jgi:hypothetical protein
MLRSTYNREAECISRGIVEVRKGLLHCIQCCYHRWMLKHRGVCEQPLWVVWYTRACYTSSQATCEEQQFATPEIFHLQSG